MSNPSQNPQFQAADGLPSPYPQIELVDRQGNPIDFESGGDGTGAVLAHEAKSNPHPQYALDADLTALQTLISTEVAEQDTINSNVAIALSQEAATREEAISELTEQIDDLSGVVATKANQTDVANQVAALQTADSAIVNQLSQKADQSNLEAEITARQAGVSAIAQSLQQEATTRSTQVQMLQSVIDQKPNRAELTAERTAREEAVSDLETAIALKANQADLNNEVATRQSADEAISDRITDLEDSLGSLATKNQVADSDIGDRTANDALEPSGLTGSLTQWFGWIANRIRAITGKSSWWVAPAITLEAVATRLNQLGSLSNQNANNVNITGGTIQGIGSLNASYFWVLNRNSQEGDLIQLEGVSSHSFRVSGFAGLFSTGTIRTTNATPSTSTTTGAIVAAGGLGIGGSGYFGGDVFAQGVNLRAAIQSLQAGTVPDESITNIKIAPNAAIDWSKISKSGAIPGDIGAATTQSVANLQAALSNLENNSNLSQISALSPVSGRFLYFNSTGWIARALQKADMPYATDVTQTTSSTTGAIITPGGVACGSLNVGGYQVDGSAIVKRLFVQNTAQTVTGTTSAVVVASYTIPANTLNPNSCLLFELLFTLANTTGFKAVRLRIGSTTVWTMTATTNHQGVVKQLTLRNQGAMDSQVAINLAVNSYAASTSGISTFAIDFTVSQTVTVEIQNSATTEVSALRGFSILHY